MRGAIAGSRRTGQRIVQFAQHGIQREYEGEEVKREKDEAEGVLYQRPQSSGEWVTILEWYGRWRPLKKGTNNAGASSGTSTGAK